MLTAGGNSTLEALRQLLNETGDDRFKRVNCVYHEYRGEDAILAQHLGENLNRGDMRFWEVAVGISKLIGMIQEAAGKELILADIETELTKRGIPAKKTIIGLWIFAAKRLAAFGVASIALTKHDVAAIQPRLNQIRKLAAKFGLSEETYWEQVVDPALAGIGIEYEAAAEKAVFSATAACDACEVALEGRRSVASEPLAPVAALALLLSREGLDAVQRDRLTVVLAAWRLRGPQRLS